MQFIAEASYADKAATLIQRVYRSYVCKGVLINEERMALSKQIRDWAMGYTQKLMDHKDLQDIYSQALLQSAISLAKIQSRPIRNLPSLKEVKTCSRALWGKQQELQWPAELLRKEYEARQKERALMRIEDRWTRLWERLGEQLKKRAKEFAQRLEEKARLERMEEAMRRQRMALMSMVQRMQAEEVEQRIVREEMFREEYTLRRFLQKDAALMKKAVNTDYELMKYEDQMAQLLRCQEKEMIEKSKILAAETELVRLAKIRGDEEYGEGGKRFKRTLNERVNWKLKHKKVGTEVLRKLDAQNKESVRAVSLLIRRWREPFSLRKQLPLRPIDQPISAGKKDNGGTQSTHSSITGGAPSEVSQKVYFSAPHRKNDEDFSLQSVSDGDFDAASALSSTPWWRRSNKDSLTQSGAERFISASHEIADLFSREVKFVTRMSVVSSVLAASANGKASTLGGGALASVISVESLSENSSISHSLSAAGAVGTSPLAMVRARYHVHKWDQHRFQQLTLLRAIRHQRIIFQRKAFVALASFECTHQQLTSMREQLLRDKISCRLERKKRQSIAEKLEQQLPGLRAQIIYSNRILVDLLRREGIMVAEMFAPEGDRQFKQDPDRYGGQALSDDDDDESDEDRSDLYPNNSEAQAVGGRTSASAKMTSQGVPAVEQSGGVNTSKFSKARSKRIGNAFKNFPRHADYSRTTMSMRGGPLSLRSRAGRGSLLKRQSTSTASSTAGETEEAKSEGTEVEVDGSDKETTQSGQGSETEAEAQAEKTSSASGNGVKVMTMQELRERRAELKQQSLVRNFWSIPAEGLGILESAEVSKLLATAAEAFSSNGPAATTPTLVQRAGTQKGRAVRETAPAVAMGPSTEAFARRGSAVLLSTTYMGKYPPLPPTETCKHDEKTRIAHETIERSETKVDAELKSIDTVQNPAKLHNQPSDEKSMANENLSQVAHGANSLRLLSSPSSMHAEKHSQDKQRRQPSPSVLTEVDGWSPALSRGSSAASTRGDQLLNEIGRNLSPLPNRASSIDATGVDTEFTLLFNHSKSYSKPSRGTSPCHPLSLQTNENETSFAAKTTPGRQEPVKPSPPKAARTKTSPYYIPGEMLFLEKDASAYDFVQWSRAVRGWTQDVCRWMRALEEAWRERKRQSCISYLQRIYWLMGSLGHKNDLKMDANTSFNGSNNCQPTAAQEDLKNEYLSDRDARIPYLVNTAEPLDLFEILLCRAGVKVQIFEPTSQRTFKIFLNVAVCDTLLARNPASACARCFLYELPVLQEKHPKKTDSTGLSADVISSATSTYHAGSGYEGPSKSYGNVTQIDCDKMSTNSSAKTFAENSNIDRVKIGFVTVIERLTGRDVASMRDDVPSTATKNRKMKFTEGLEEELRSMTLGAASAQCKTSSNLSPDKLLPATPGVSESEGREADKELLSSPLQPFDVMNRTQSIALSELALSHDGDDDPSASRSKLSPRGKPKPSAKETFDSITRARRQRPTDALDTGLRRKPVPQDRPATVIKPVVTAADNTESIRLESDLADILRKSSVSAMVFGPFGDKSALMTAVRDELTQLKEFVTALLQSSFLTDVDPSSSPNGKKVDRILATFDGKATAIKGGKRRRRPKTIRLFLRLDCVQPCKFIKTDISSEEWICRIPRWMQPAYHWGDSAIGAIKRRKLKRERQRVELLHQQADNAARTLIRVLKHRVLRRRARLERMMSDYRHAVDQALMSWEDAAGSFCRQKRILEDEEKRVLKINEEEERKWASRACWCYNTSKPAKILPSVPDLMTAKKKLMLKLKLPSQRPPRIQYLTAARGDNAIARKIHAQLNEMVKPFGVEWTKPPVEDDRISVAVNPHRSVPLSRLGAYLTRHVASLRTRHNWATGEAIRERKSSDLRSSVKGSLRTSIMLTSLLSAGNSNFSGGSSAVVSDSSSITSFAPVDQLMRSASQVRKAVESVKAAVSCALADAHPKFSHSYSPKFEEWWICGGSVEGAVIAAARVVEDSGVAPRGVLRVELLSAAASQNFLSSKGGAATNLGNDGLLSKINEAATFSKAVSDLNLAAASRAANSLRIAESVGIVASVRTGFAAGRSLCSHVRDEFASYCLLHTPPQKKQRVIATIYPRQSMKPVALTSSSELCRSAPANSSATAMRSSKSANNNRESAAVASVKAKSLTMTSPSRTQSSLTLRSKPVHLSAATDLSASVIGLPRSSSVMMQVAVATTEAARSNEPSDGLAPPTKVTRQFLSEIAMQRLGPHITGLRGGSAGDGQVVLLCDLAELQKVFANEFLVRRYSSPAALKAVVVLQRLARMNFAIATAARLRLERRNTMMGANSQSSDLTEYDGGNFMITHVGLD